MAFNDEEDDGFGQYVATQEFIETSEAIASLYHHSLKVLIEVKDLPFVLGRDKTKASVVTHDPNLEPTKQKCSGVHAIIEKKEGGFHIQSKGPHGTAILRRGVTINIPVDQWAALEDGDGIKLASLNEANYRYFIYTWSLPNNLPLKELLCKDCTQFFPFSPHEQAFFIRKGFDDPIRCSDCREKKKAEKQHRGIKRDRDRDGHYGPGTGREVSFDRGVGGGGGKMKRGGKKKSK
ncbi:MAG: hypothetical protein EBT47_13540 [Chloroflexi bacterium]|nr:hypothetical protein [Chloroflexota bacterium]